MVMEHEAAIGLLQPSDGVRFRHEPVVLWIIGPELGGRWLRVEADEPAVAALDDLEDFIGGVVQAVGGAKQNVRGFGAAGGAGFCWINRRGIDGSWIGKGS